MRFSGHMVKALMAGFYLCANGAVAQIQIESHGHYGFIIPHREGVKNLITGHVRAGDLFVEHRVSGDKVWHHKWRFPYVGVGFGLADLGNPKQLGMSAVLYPYMRFTVAKWGRLTLHYKIGSGLGYISKRFDPDLNYKNIMVGSHFNIVAKMAGECRFKVNERLWFSAGLFFTHYSNGAFKVPNLGINVPSASVGIRYGLGQATTPLTPRDTAYKPPKRELLLYGSFGLKENYPVGYRKYGTYAVSTVYNQCFGYRSKLSFMLDFFYNSSLRPLMAADNMPSRFIDVSQQGFMLAYHSVVGKMSIVAGQGVYYRTVYKKDTHFYHRIGVFYQVTERISARWMLKTHFFKADYFEFGLGYRLL